MTVLEVLQRSERWLSSRSTTARLDAELLIGHALGLDRVGVYLAYDRPLQDEERAHLRELVRARGQGRPVAYITGEKEFYGVRLSVDERVLVPRPETEGVVDRALAALGDGPVLVGDVGTGSGAIACAIAHERKGTKVIATELDPDAATVARANSARIAPGQVAVIRSDLLAGVEDGSLDLVVSNPPYIREGDSQLHPHVAAHEPALALYAGADGMSVYRRLLPEAARALKPGGWLVVELGAEQGPPVGEAATGAGFEIADVRPDLAGIPRVLAAVRC